MEPIIMLNRPILKLPFKIKAPEMAAAAVDRPPSPAPANAVRTRRAARYPLLKSYHAAPRT